jgi:DNA mismatch repair protein MutL
MAKIALMKPELANLIAAGEVIERPSSVIKELAENSIDAGAKSVYIGVTDAGKGTILVKDDGSGMDREDARTCFLRHASSKIHSEYDLSRIHTLGFRGEAIPSIASVSRMTLTTSDGTSGTKVVSVPNEELQVAPAMARKGTIFEVKDLFFNTPARLKYLKSNQAETYAIVEMAEHIALGFPGVALSLAIDGREIFHTSGRGDLLETIQKIYGNTTALSLYPFSHKEVGYTLEGYASKPEVNFSKRYNMLTFLNHRFIYDYRINKAIENAYRDFLAPDRYPFLVLDLTIDPSLVDVNVHPTKKEVRISCENEIGVALEDTLKDILKEKKPIYNAGEDEKTKKVEGIDDPFDMKDLQKEEEKKIEDQEKKNADPLVPAGRKNSYFQDSLPFNPTYESQAVRSFIDENHKNPEEEVPSSPASSPEKATSAGTKETDYYAPVLPNPTNTDFPVLFPIGQVLETYIICNSRDSFYLIDQHAAAERINFEKTELLFQSVRSRVVPLIPIVIDLSFKEKENYDEEHKARLLSLGIVTEPFGDRTIKVTEIPSFLSEDEGNVVEDTVHSALNNEKEDPISLLRLTIANIACKKSIKANHIMSLSEMEGLIKDLSHCKNPANCPHGRPTMIQITRADIEKIFRRSGF